MKKALSGIRIVLVASALSIAATWLLLPHRCSDTEYRELPYIDGSQYDDYYAMPGITEQNAVKALSSMLTQCPHASRYVVEWGYEGRSFGGHVSGVTIFYRKKAFLQHTRGGTYQDIQENRLALYPEFTKRLYSVSTADIQAVAKVNGNLAILRKRLNRKSRKPVRSK